MHLTDTDKRAPGFGSLPFGEAFGHLRRAGYDATMSIECRWKDLAPVAQQSIKFVRDAWEASA